MSYEHKEGYFTLFKNKFHEPGGKLPNYRGDGMVNGEMSEAAAWVKTTAKGDKYISLHVQPRREKSAEGAPRQSAQEEMNDDIGF